MPKVHRSHMDVALGARVSVGLGSAEDYLDSILEVFSNLNNSVILLLQEKGRTER